MYRGCYTALVTPFTKKGDVDYERFRDLIEFQIKNGVDGIVPVGTTGESPTVDYKEHERIVEVAVEAARKRVKVVAGTGANSTAEALELTRHAKDAGADATLQVTPYYNKPNQVGLLKHFTAVADLGLPVMLYNIPGRTGREITVDTVVEMAKHPNVVAIKEAGGSIDRVTQIASRCKLDILSGDDSLTLPMMIAGASGVVSVASNVAPKLVTEMTHLALSGKWDAAKALHFKLFRLFTDLFIDTNPTPVKAALAMMGMMEETFRLPLCETTPANKEVVRGCLKELGIL